MHVFVLYCFSFIIVFRSLCQPIQVCCSPCGHVQVQVSNQSQQLTLNTNNAKTVCDMHANTLHIGLKYFAYTYIFSPNQIYVFLLCITLIAMTAKSNKYIHSLEKFLNLLFL